jgi:hypothetical protein
MLLEEEEVELRAWCTVSVAALPAPSSRAPHLLQNSLSWGGAAEHDGQSLNLLSFPAELIYQGRLLSRLYNGTSRVGVLTTHEHYSSAIAPPPCCTISNQMASDEDLKAEIERLRAENEALKKPARGRMSLKVSEKGGLSVYGLGRFPVTLYREQWEKLLGMADEIRNFIRENEGSLKKKE